MNIQPLRHCLLIAFFFLAGQGWGLETSATRNLLPVPAEAGWDGSFLELNSHFKIAFEGVREARTRGAVKRFVKRLKKRTGIRFLNPMGKEDKGAVLTVECQGRGLPVQTVREDESYALSITPAGAKLSAPNPLGILHGLETFLQLVEPQGKDYVLPCGRIQDKPRFAWRGLLIDVCRHWEPVEVIHRNLDGMEESKLNVFHWHLSEDQGFRVESRKFPKLQGMGSEGNYYTQEQIREVVAYARARGIRVVPEFDMPGHATAWLVGYPQFASAPGPYQIERHFGIFDPTFNPTNEKVYQFIDEFLSEVAPLFPDEYFHIGGDEVNGRQWEKNPEIQAFMKSHGFKTNQDLQTYFNGRLQTLLTRHGKKMVGWDEVLNPNLPKSIVVQSWRGPQALGESATRGYDGILSDGYYLDHIRTASFHYGVDPVPSGSPLAPAQRAHVLGGEVCMWGEYVNPETIDSRIWPRTLAVAERLWSPEAVKDTDDFYRRMEAESVRLGELGLTHQSNYLPMLRRLAGDGGVKALKTLADVVEPVKFYERSSARDYTTQTPLDALVDAVRPESLEALAFQKEVDQFLKDAPRWGGDGALQDALQRWSKNPKKIKESLEKPDKVPEAEVLSSQLSDASRIGLEALGFLKSGKVAPGSWPKESQKALSQDQEPRAALEIVVIPGIRKLALAAGQSDKVKGNPVAWNRFLDAQVKSLQRKSAD